MISRARLCAASLRDSRSGSAPARPQLTKSPPSSLRPKVYVRSSTPSVHLHHRVHTLGGQRTIVAPLARSGGSSADPRRDRALVLPCEQQPDDLVSQRLLHMGFAGHQRKALAASRNSVRATPLRPPSMPPETIMTGVQIASAHGSRRRPKLAKHSAPPATPVPSPAPTPAAAAPGPVGTGYVRLHSGGVSAATTAMVPRRARCGSVSCGGRCPAQPATADRTASRTQRRGHDLRITPPCGGIIAPEGSSRQGPPAARAPRGAPQLAAGEGVC